MTVLDARQDAQELTLTFVAEFDAPPERVWRIWSDARQLERWWGPPEWPATFADHELREGARSHYFMTGPEGQQEHGFWVITSTDEPSRLEFDDGFADDQGRPRDEPDTMHVVVTLEAAGSGTRMTTVSRFRSADQLQRMLDMGVEEGMRSAMGQIDALLAA